MKPEEYKKIVDLMAVYPQKIDNFGLAYAYLGLIGESDELEKSSLEETKKEFGDCLWYIAAISKEANLNFKRIIDINRKDYELSLEYLAENIKKFYRDRKEINKEYFEDVLTDHLVYLHELANYPDIEECMQINYDKLMKRKKEGKLKGDGDNR